MTIEYKDSKRIVGLSTDVLETPTMTDDMSSDNYTHLNGNTSVSGGKLLYAQSSADNRAYRSITQVASTFVIQWETVLGTASNGHRYHNLVLSEENTNVKTTSSNDGYAIVIDGKSGSVSSVYIQEIYGGTVNQSGALLEDLSQSAIHYFTFSRSGNVLTVESFSDSARTVSEGSGSLTLASTSTGFVFLQHGTENPSTTVTGVTIDNIKYYNGVSSLSSKPTDVQDNSLLVQKDTARRYWFDAGVESNVELTTGAPFVGHGTGWLGKAWISELSDLPNVGDVVTGGKIYVGTSAGNVRLGLYSDNGSGVPQTLLAETASTAVGSAGTWQEIDFISSYTTTSTDKLHLGLQTDSNGSGFGYATNVSLARSEMVTSYGAFPTTFSGTSDNTPADLRAVVERPAASTWTMQPTFQDDFSSYADVNTGNTVWSSENTSYTYVDITNDRLHVNQPYSTGIHAYVARDMGANVVDSDKWIAQWKMILTTSGTSTLFGIGFSDTDETVSSNTVGDHISFKVSRQGTDGLYLESSNSVFYGGNNAVSNSFYPTLNTDYWYELIRDGSTATLNVYSDSTYSTLEGTTTSTITTTGDLRYFKIGNTDWDVTTSIGDASLTLDDWKFYNGVTSIN